MATILMSAHPASGHINPLLTLADRLTSRGHEVIFSTYGPKAIREKITRRGFEVEAVRTGLGSVALIALPYLSGLAETRFALRCMLMGLPRYARQHERIIQRRGVDLVVYDFSFPAADLAAERLGVPSALIYHAGLSLRGPGVPPFASGLPIGEAAAWPADLVAAAEDLGRVADRQLAKARRALGLPPGPGRYLEEMPARCLNLTLTTEASEAPRHAPPPTTWFIGPCFAPPPSGDDGFPWGDLDEARPKIYVSLGTVFNRKPEVFKRIIAAAEGLDVQLIISGGGAYEALAPLGSERVRVFPFVPQVALLPKVDVVISHGGNNTTNETLAAGRPLLVIPVGGEQADNAARVVHLGVGLRAEMDAFTPAGLRAQLRRLLEEPAFRARAREIAAAIGRTDGADTGARLLERLLETRAPILRGAGDPLTLEAGAPLPGEARPVEASSGEP